MRSTEAFALGTMVGAVVVWLWGREVEDYVGDRTRAVRAQAAEGLRVVEKRTGEVLERGGSSLRRAEDFLEDTKAHVTETLRAGQEAMRPGAGPGPA
jgi:hypothetical protein